MAGFKDWIRVRIFGSRMEAEIAKSLLESCEIEARIRADDVGGMRPPLALASGVELWVQRWDEAEAREILEDAESGATEKTGEVE